jgi:microcin C transport system substrate-binding protein
MMRFLRLTLLIGWFFNVSVAAPQNDFSRSHGLAMHGNPALAADFAYFPYVNPNAPKQGAIRYDARGTFDSFNIFIVKGTPAVGIGRIYDTLMVTNPDEPFSRYGLLAESVDLAVDRSWVRFNLNSKARFHDGQPVTADDVVFTFNLLMGQGAPFYRAYYDGVLSVEAQSRLSVVFHFDRSDNQELALILSELPVLPKHFWRKHTFNRADLTIPLGSGPYQLVEFEAGRSVTYRLSPDYWAKDLPVAIGRDNIEQVTYEYYRDSSVALEAFKSGRVDFRLENNSKVWASAYQGPMFDQGKIIREALLDLTPQGMQGFVFNLRRDKFKDIRVRQALALMFDFEWTNTNLFYSAYTRTQSYFDASELAAKGLPSGAELRYLEPFRKQLPPELFTQAFDVPKTDGSGNMRPQMRRALSLLKPAGWVLKEGRLVNAKGEPFQIEFLVFQSSFERVILPFIKNLERIGIRSELRLVDISQYINRTQRFDFDMVTQSFGQSASPGNEQRNLWGSEAADRHGSANLIGIKDPVIDSLIESVIHASSRDELVSAVRALDRVLLWGHYVVPQWYINQWRVAYWHYLKRPERTPKYDIGLDAWWIEE